MLEAERPTDATGIQCYGLWVPQSDAEVFSRYGEFEGLPDLDVSKVAKCVARSKRLTTALDIGAHVGAVSLFLARKFAKVVAFEAIPETFEFLRRNTCDTRNIKVRNVAIGADFGEAYFDHYPSHGQLSHISAAAPETEQVGPVPIKPIDSFSFTDVAFIKIDVEGYELPVLEGALKTIKRCRPLILIEQNGNEELHFGRPRDEASHFLETLGMKRHAKEPPMGKDRLYTF